MCFSTPGLSEHISGVILHWETLFQKDAAGKQMVDIIKENGMIPGIKVDKAYNKKGMWGTQVGPLGHPEVATVGLDDLQQRCAQAAAFPWMFRLWKELFIAMVKNSEYSSNQENGWHQISKGMVDMLILQSKQTSSQQLAATSSSAGLSAGRALCQVAQRLAVGPIQAVA